MARARQLVGRTIVAVDFRLFRADDHSPPTWAADPVLTLDNGARVQFVTQETEQGRYGTQICISPAQRRAKPPRTTSR